MSIEYEHLSSAQREIVEEMKKEKLANNYKKQTKLVLSY
jgi:hypothetical protein